MFLIRRLAANDVTGVMTFLDMESHHSFHSSTDSGTNKELSKFERKDVWAICWASDNPELLAIMEKTRMYILRGVEPEEPILSSGYICTFKVSYITHYSCYYLTLKDL